MRREIPILFSDPMVKAILARSKCETRRLTHGRPKCRYGGPGDLLWVREGVLSLVPAGVYREGRAMRSWPSIAHERNRLAFLRESCKYSADLEEPTVRQMLRGSWGRLNKLFQPRWASRIELDILDVRREKLLDIDEAGAVAEGFQADRDEGEARRAYFKQGTARWNFLKGWESLHGLQSWEANPEVWVVRWDVSTIRVRKLA